MLFRHPVSGSEVPPSTCLYIDHFNSCLQHCSNIEKTLQQFYGNFNFFFKSDGRENFWVLLKNTALLIDPNYKNL